MTHNFTYDARHENIARSALVVSHPPTSQITKPRNHQKSPKTKLEIPGLQTTRPQTTPFSSLISSWNSHRNHRNHLPIVPCPGCPVKSPALPGSPTMAIENAVNATACKPWISQPSLEGWWIAQKSLQAVCTGLDLYQNPKQIMGIFDWNYQPDLNCWCVFFLQLPPNAQMNAYNI